MKNYALFAVIVTFAISGCEDYKTELDHSIRKNDSLMVILNNRDSSISDFLQSYSDIQQNLDSIVRKRNTITSDMENQVELKGTTKDRIIENINAINELLIDNRKKIDALNRKLQNSSYKNKELQKMIETLNLDLARKDEELASLNNQLLVLNANIVQLQTSVDTLNADITSKSQTISDQTATLHTAYYIVGKAKELEEKNVIDKTGGVLGMGKTAKLSSSFDNTNFTKIDYTQVNSIDISSKNAKIVTTHPTDSYTLDKNKDMINALQITNPEKFWSASKYLIIVKN